jgi:hypothetical protein
MPATSEPSSPRARSPMRRGAVALIVGAALPVAALASCNAVEVHEVTLSFTYRDGGGPRGFTCPSRNALRLLSAERKLSLVVDVISVPTLTRCRNVEFVDLCTSGACRPDPAARKCVPLDVNYDVDSGAAAVEELTRALRALRGQPVTRRVPAEPVIVRAVVMAEPCDAIGARSDLSAPRVLGCAASCPQVISGSDVDLPLDLDTLEPATCERDVLVCATGRVQDAGAP